MSQPKERNVNVGIESYVLVPAQQDPSVFLQCCGLSGYISHSHTLVYQLMSYPSLVLRQNPLLSNLPPLKPTVREINAHFENSSYTKLHVKSSFCGLFVLSAVSSFHLIHPSDKNCNLYCRQRASSTHNAPNTESQNCTTDTSNGSLCIT